MTTALKPGLILLFPLFFCSGLKAQLEVAHLSAKGFSGNGFGSYLNFGISVSDADALTVEGGFYYFGDGDNHIAIAPVLAGFRHTLDGTGVGWYAEGNLGYTFGGSDIQKSDQYGGAIPNGSGGWLDQNVAGPAAGLVAGYIFPGAPINLGLHYERIFVSGDPALNLLSLRVSYFMCFGRRSE